MFWYEVKTGHETSEIKMADARAIDDLAKLLLAVDSPLPFHLLRARELGLEFRDISAQHLAVEEDPGAHHEIEGAGSALHPASLKEQCSEFIVAHLVR